MSTAGNIGGGIGAGVGAAFGAPMLGQQIGQAAGTLVQPVLQEFSPAAVAQRKLWKEARNRIKTGTYGYTEAEKQKASAPGQMAAANQTAQANADIARAQAGGQLSGGQATEALRQAYFASAAQNAQNAQMVQAASDAAAQRQYAEDQGRIDQQAGLARRFWQDDAEKEDIDWTGMIQGNQDMSKYDAVFGNRTSARPPTPVK